MQRDFLFLVIGMACACALLLVLRSRSQARVARPTVPLEPLSAETQFGRGQSATPSSVSIFSVENSEGGVVIDAWEGRGIPARAMRLPLNDSAVKHTSQLATDLLKGAATLPGKTIEVVFKPEIQKGLTEGTYTLMKTTTGETLADAIHKTNGKIVGKGRLVETGQLKQWSAGIFQLASIAVAQAHLADIERSLQGLRGDISKVLDSLAATDRAQLIGSIDYLRDIARYLSDRQSADILPAHRKNQIEDIVRGSHIWRAKLEEDIKALVARVEAQTDKDKFGKSDTYQQMCDHLDEAYKLAHRRELLRQLFTLLSVVLAWVDPLQKEFGRPQFQEGNWEDHLKSLKIAINRQSVALFASAVSESNDLLRLRRETLSFKGEDLFRIGLEQKKVFEERMEHLASNVELYFKNDAGMRVALTFDDSGTVRDAALV